MIDPDLKIKITADGAQANRVLSELQANFSGFSSAANALKGGLVSVGAVVASLTSGAIVAFGKRIIDDADAMGKAAQKAGITTEAFSALNYAASQSEVSATELSTALRFMGRALVESGNQGSESARVFAALGVSTRDAAGNLRAADAVLTDLASAFKALPDGTLKSEAAVKLFGRSGTSMIDLLNQGSDGLSAFANEARKLGLVISDETAKSADEFNDNLGRLKGSLIGLANEALPSVLSGLNKLTAFFGATSARPVVAGSEFVRAQIDALKKEIAEINLSRNNLFAPSESVISAEIKKRREEIREYEALFERTAKYEADLASKSAKSQPSAKSLQEALAGKNEKGGLSEAGREAKKLADEYQRAIDATRTPLEKFNIEIERAYELFRKFGNTDLFERQSRSALDKLPPTGTDQYDPESDPSVSAQRDNAKEYAALQERLKSREMLIEESYFNQSRIIANALAEGYANESQAQTEMLALTEQYNIRRAELHNAAGSAMLEADQFAHNQRSSIISQAGDLLSVFASKSKGAAIAYIAFQKGLAIADIFISAQRAAWQAQATIPPPAGQAIAATILAQSKISMGLVAATGIAQIASLGQGGGNTSRGGGNSSYQSPQPIPPQRVESSTNPNAGQTVNIFIEGNVVDMTELARSLRPYNIRLATDTI